MGYLCVQYRFQIQMLIMEEFIDKEVRKNSKSITDFIFSKEFPF
jgi:hypothetical protein